MTEQKAAVPPEAHPPPWWRRPDGRIAMLTISVAIVVVLVQLVIPGGMSWSRDDAVLLCVITALSAATEGFAIHIRVRRGAHALSLSEIPMVLGLLTAGPLALLVGRVVGGGAGMLLVRRQRGSKLGFNTALLAAHATVAALVFRTFAGTPAQLGPRQWLAAYAATIAADVLSGVLVTVAISLHDDPDQWRRLPMPALRGVPLVTVTTSIALVGALVVRNDPRAVALLVVVCFVVFLAYRGYVRQTQGHEQVEGLYSFTRALDDSLDSREVARTVLSQSRDQLRAEAATLVVPLADGGWLRTRIGDGDDTTEETLTDLPGDAWWTPALRGAAVLLPTGSTGRPGAGPVDGIAVPVAIGDAGTGALLVTDSLPDIGTFDDLQLRLFQALANHAGLSLAKAGLVDRLRTEVSEKAHLALHDPLTGLPNRRRFQQLLDARLAEAGSAITAVLLLDLDRFKEVNDALGHDTGDTLLREVAGRLQHHIGTRGQIARLGGDEFAVLLPAQPSGAEAVSAGEAIAQVLDEPVTIGHMTLSTRASIGIAYAPEHGTDAQTLLQRADVAMYAAKQSRAGTRVYQPRDDNNSPDRLALIADLAEAIARRELMVEFQPKLDPAAGLVTGAEALARWHHGGKFIPPDVFIPLAEHSGLIRPLTLHVLEIALRRCAAWRRAGHDLHVAVNLSPNGLHDSTLPEVVARLLGQTGVPAS